MTKNQQYDFVVRARNYKEKRTEKQEKEKFEDLLDLPTFKSVLRVT